MLATTSSTQVPIAPKKMTVVRDDAMGPLTVCIRHQPHVNPRPSPTHVTELCSPPERKKPKRTYHARKEEMAERLDEIEALEAELKRLKERKTTQPVPCPLQQSQHHHMHHAVMENSKLHSDIQQRDLSIAASQSLFSNYMAARCSNPLESYIHLTTDATQRRQTLLALRDPKLHDGIAYLSERCRFLDLRYSHKQRESHTTRAGDFIYTSFDITPFPHVESVKQVYDALLYHYMNQDVTLNEMLNMVTTRDMCDRGEPMISQDRYHSTLGGRLQCEVSNAMFYKYAEQTAQLDQPHGIVVIDAIDKDDIHPYQVQERIRHDITCATMVIECPRYGQNQERVISIARWVYARTHRPPFELSAEDTILVQESIPNWVEAMPKHVALRLSCPKRTD